MQHNDHVRLLRAGVEQPPDGAEQPGGVWADIGAGSGAFTLALADLLGPGATIYAVDRDSAALRAQRQAREARFPGVRAHFVTADFTRPLDLPPLDGIVMANALHFVAPDRQAAALRQLRGLLSPRGRFIIVEYNAERGNLWVPHPVSFARWQQLAPLAGFATTRFLAAHPSSFLREIYAALAE